MQKINGKRNRLGFVFIFIFWGTLFSWWIPGVFAQTQQSTKSWMLFVDTYKRNVNSTPEGNSLANPAIGVLSWFLEMYTPGSSWDNGIVLNKAVHETNLQTVLTLARNRSSEEERAAYLDDRRKQSYSIIEGLGPLAEVYRRKAGATTTILDVAPDATTTKYDDKGTDGGDPNSEVGAIVNLVKILRGNFSSTNPAKNFYNYPRPFRWLDTSVVIPPLVPCISPTPATDGGFPSGHTNAAYLAAYAMAYAIPERYQELLTRASELGHNRILAGMHSPLDVMGGRIMATALAAAILSDPDNEEIKKAAYEQGRLLIREKGTGDDPFADHAKNKANFNRRLTYDFKPVGPTDKTYTVPKGAEVLLETRFPYLTNLQRRDVLASTVISSGYPLLDDPEGWGRLNLFAASDGYGSFSQTVEIVMDAQRGGFAQQDIWRNDISGVGGLIKRGTGTLVLAGQNSYTGGTVIQEGILETRTPRSLGKGAVTVTGGSLIKAGREPLVIEGNYIQERNGTLEITLGSPRDGLDCRGTLRLDGLLRLRLVDGFIPFRNPITIITHGPQKRSGQFMSIEVTGASGYRATLQYQTNQIQVVFEKRQ